VASILIVEDEHRIRELVAKALADRGHDVESVTNAMDGLHAITAQRPDLVILDLGLPDLDGYDLLKMVRAVSDVPVIVATARGDDPQVIRTLDAGADDYIVKPFAIEQLEARVRAVLRRSDADRTPDTIVVGGLRINAAARQVEVDEQPVDLTPKEFELLLYLAQHAGEVISKRKLLAEVWRQPYGGSDKTIDVHLSVLRRKLGESATDPRFLHTVFRVGVKLQAPE
jgi:DNA-binding response OmpR family regulator